MRKDKTGNNIKFQITIGVIMIIIGISFLLNDFIVQKREETFNRMNIELNDLMANAEEKNELIAENTSDTSIETRNKVLENIDYETYVGYLEIPKINFKKGFYKKESNLNDVKTNIKILKESNYPDEDKGNVIIIGHSGNYSNSYFGELYKINQNDEAIITFNNKTYTYKVTNIYNESKDGTITIYRDTGKSTLTLITCTKDDETSQTIYILELVNIK